MTTTLLLTGLLSFVLFTSKVECQAPGAGAQADRLRQVAGNAMRGDYDDLINQAKNRYGPFSLKKEVPVSHGPAPQQENNPLMTDQDNYPDDAGDGSKTPGSKQPAGEEGPGALSPVMEGPKGPAGASETEDHGDGEEDNQNLQDRDHDDSDDDSSRGSHLKGEGDGDDHSDEGHETDDQEKGGDTKDPDEKGDPDSEPDDDSKGDKEEKEEEPEVPYIVPPKLPKYKPKKVMVPLGTFLANMRRYGYKAAMYPYASNNPFMYGRRHGHGGGGRVMPAPVSRKLRRKMRNRPRRRSRTRG